MAYFASIEKKIKRLIKYEEAMSITDFIENIEEATKLARNSFNGYALDSARASIERIQARNKAYESILDAYKSALIKINLKKEENDCLKEEINELEKQLNSLESQHSSDMDYLEDYIKDI